MFESKSKEGDIRLSMKLFSIVRWIRHSLAVLIVLAYFGGQEWVLDVVLIAVTLLLVFPMGFFDVFIQKLVEHNTSQLEDRVRLNAEEANRTFVDVYSKIKVGASDDN